MPVLFVTTPGARVSLISERLHIESPAPADGELLPPPPRDVPLHDIEQVVADERANLTTPALCECLRRQIPIVLVSRTQTVLGLCQPPGGSSQARLAQYQRHHDTAFGLALAAALVEAKIQNSRRVLQRLAANRADQSHHLALTALEHLRQSCLDARSIDTLRGYEGAAAAQYFETYAAFFPSRCPFSGRSKRPPLDPPNAILSFAYTLLASECASLLHGSGLDPLFGFLHPPTDRRPSLALDLMEPFRAPVADGLALDLLGHDVLRPTDHFEYRDSGCYLNTEGRRRFFTAYERRLAREFTSEQHGLRTSLRAELRRQAHSLKRAIVANEAFEPFLMN